MRMWKALLALVAVMAAFALVVTGASARKNNNPGQKRDVIVVAQVVCGGPFAADVDLIAICDLIDKTDGEQIIAGACTDCFDPGGGCTDIGDVNYEKRNCDRNEEALLRLASSAALSWEDFLNGKQDQDLSAAAYLCRYSAKASDLVNAGKLSGVDVADLAESIADVLVGGAACI